SWTGTTEGGANSYPQGATHLIVSSTANMAAGRIVQLDQLEETTDDGGLTQSALMPIFATWDTSGQVRCTLVSGHCTQNRVQQQIVKVVSVDDSTHITITPGLYMNGWRSSQKPMVAGWGNTDG